MTWRSGDGDRLSVSSVTACLPQNLHVVTPMRRNLASVPDQVNEKGSAPFKKCLRSEPPKYELLDPHLCKLATSNFQGICQELF